MSQRAALNDPRSMSGADYRVLQEGLIRFGDGLADLADSDERIVAGSADLTVSTLLTTFAERHSDRFFQFGISERNMVSVAAGLATVGFIPFVSTFAAFASLMCVEQIRTDLAYPRVPVRVIGTHAGVALGFLSTSHHATEDLGLLRSISGLTILSPPDGETALRLIAETMEWPGPIYLRLGRGRDEGTYSTPPADYRPGTPHVARTGQDVALVATGIMVKRALEAAEILAGRGITASVLDVHTIKPFDGEAIAKAVSGHQAAVTIEEHNTNGGLGSMVAEALFEHRIVVDLYKHGLHDEYAIIGPPNHQLDYYGLNGEGIAAVSSRLLERGRSGTWSGDHLWSAEDRQSVLIAKRPDLI